MYDYRAMNWVGDNTPAFCARLIIENSGYVDFVSDRCSYCGPTEEKQKIMDKINSKIQYLIKDGRKKVQKETSIFSMALINLESKLKSFELTTTSDLSIVLYEDEKFIIKGNPNKSFGYCYVCAYFKELQK